MKVIGFGHKKRVGKDTATQFLISHLRQKGLSVQKLSLSDPIKTVAHYMFKWGGLQDALYYDEHEDEIEKILPAIGKSPRQIWDHIGTSMRDICEKVWCETCFSRASADIVVIPNVRTHTEIDYVLKFNGHLYRIDRKDAPKSNHIVDTALDTFTGWHDILQNHGTKKDFYNEVINKVKVP